MPSKNPLQVQSLELGADGTTIVPTRTDIPLPQPTAFWTANGHAPIAIQGADIACTNGTTYYSEVYVPYEMTVTGLGFLIGSVGGTHKVILSLHDGAGKLIANTDTA